MLPPIAPRFLIRNSTRPAGRRRQEAETQMQQSDVGEDQCMCIPHQFEGSPSRYFNAAQFGKSRSDQPSRPQISRRILHHHIGAAGDRKPRSGFAGHQRNRRMQAAGRDHS